jgi:hypothetical protein
MGFPGGPKKSADPDDIADWHCEQALKRLGIEM